MPHGITMSFTITESLTWTCSYNCSIKKIVVLLTDCKTQDVLLWLNSPHIQLQTRDTPLIFWIITPYLKKRQHTILELSSTKKTTNIINTWRNLVICNESFCNYLQLVIIYSQISCVCNYKIGMLHIFWVIWLCVQLMAYIWVNIININKLIYLIYLIYLGYLR